MSLCNNNNNNRGIKADGRKIRQCNEQEESAIAEIKVKDGFECLDLISRAATRRRGRQEKTNRGKALVRRIYKGCRWH